MNKKELQEKREKVQQGLNNEVNVHNNLDQQKSESLNKIMEFNGQLKLIDELINDLPKSKTDDIIKDKDKDNK